MARNSIHDILPPEGRRPRRPAPSNTPPVERESTFTSPNSPLGRASVRDDRNFRWSYIIGVIVIIVIILFLVFSTFFRGAQVTVYPKNTPITVSAEFEAFSEGVDEQLPYEIMTLDKTSETEVPATGREEIERRASGQIVIYNDYSSRDQRLIRNTRFETPQGLIFRIDESVVVPGQSEGLPGSIEVTVYADEPGEAYNISLTDFTVPGFKGSPQYEDFYARSETTMTGGLIGEQLVVEENILSATRSSLRESITRDLKVEARSQIPEGFVLFDDALFVDFISLPQGERGGEALVSERGTLYGVLFNEEKLAGFLSRNTIAGYDGESVGIFEMENLIFTISDKEDSRPWEENSFIFSMSGNAQIVWLYDQATLKDDLAGRNKDAIHTILSGYSGIERAEVIIRPFWKGTFPEDVGEIDIRRIVE